MEKLLSGTAGGQKLHWHLINYDIPSLMWALCITTLTFTQETLKKTLADFDFRFYGSKVSKDQHVKSVFFCRVQYGKSPFASEGARQSVQHTKTNWCLKTAASAQPSPWWMKEQLVQLKLEHRLGWAKVLFLTFRQAGASQHEKMLIVKGTEASWVSYMSMHTFKHSYKIHIQAILYYQTLVIQKHPLSFSVGPLNQLSQQNLPSVWE